MHLNIALIEDNADIRMLLQRTLESVRHKVYASASAEDFLEERGIIDVDVYLVDLNLPGEDGLSVVRRLRSISPDVGIIILTARDTPIDRVKGYENGADLYMVKPIYPPELVAALKRYTRQSSNSCSDVDGVDLHITLCKSKLSGPSGSVRLSYDEMIVLEALVRAPSHKLATWQFANLLGANLDEPFNANLPVRMARLRKKILAIGADPASLQPLRNFGYQLTVNISLVANR